MDKIFNIATSVSTPLGLSGLFAIVMLLLIKQIIVKNIFPTFTQRVSAKIITLIITLLFYLALASMALGFVGFIFVKVYDNSASSKPSSDKVMKDLPSHFETHGNQSPIIQDNKGTVIINDATHSPSTSQEKK